APVVLAAYVGVVVIARLVRRDPLSKLLFNASYAPLTIAGTDLLARLVFQPAWSALPRWAAVLAGFVIAHAVTSWLTWLFIVLLDRRRPGESARPVVHLYLTGLLNAALGLAAAEMVETVPWGAVLVALLAVTLAGVYRGYYGLLRDHRDLGVLNDFSLGVAAVGREGDGEAPELDEGAWSAAMELAREQLNATRVVLQRVPTLANPALSGPQTVVAGLPLPRPLTPGDILATDLPAGTGQVMRLLDSNPDPAVAAALAVRGAS